MQLKDLIETPNADLTDDELVRKINLLKKTKKVIDDSGEEVIVERRSKSNAEKRQEGFIKDIKSSSQGDLDALAEFLRKRKEGNK